MQKLRELGLRILTGIALLALVERYGAALLKLIAAVN